MPRLHSLASTLCLALLVALAPACVTGKSKANDTSYNASYNGPVSLSAILARPLSWEKLDDLETWLTRYGDRASGPDRNSARLALADGRASFARRDQGQVAAAVLATRKGLARDAYNAVLSDPAATSYQRERASSGVATLGNVWAGAPTTASTPRVGTSLSIIPRQSWGAAREVPRHMSRHVAPWSVITVHHTAMPLGSSSTLAGRSAELRTIQRAHLNRPEGWGDVGYHFLIDPEGRIYEGRRLSWRGAHVGGQNDHNLGVCLLGNFNEYKPTPAAIRSLERLLDDLRAKNGIPRSNVRYHRDWPTANTECPGDGLVPVVENYRRGLTTSSLTQQRSAPRSSLSSAQAKPTAARTWKPTGSTKVQ